jgi:hypothetical protein
LKVAQKQQEKEERALLKIAQKSLAKQAYSRPPEPRKVPLKTSNFYRLLLNLISPNYLKKMRLQSGYSSEWVGEIAKVNRRGREKSLPQRFRLAQ